MMMALDGSSSARGIGDPHAAVAKIETPFPWWVGQAAAAALADLGRPRVDRDSAGPRGSRQLATRSVGERV